MHTIIGSLLTVVVITFSGTLPAADPDAPDVSKWLARTVEAGVPGLAVVVTKGEHVVVSTGAGDADGVLIGPTTPFRIESLSKSFTATAVMQLVETGDVGLDQPIRRYLPDFKLNDPRAEGITVRHVLNQSSGITDLALGFDQYAEGPQTLALAVRQLRSTKLAHEPGAAWSYSNPNYWLAARLVEVVSGEPFSDYLEANIFEPLGMQDTSNRDVYDASAAVRGHAFVFGRTVGIDPPRSFVGGAGGVISTAADMSRWLRFQQGATLPGTDESILGQAPRDEMHRRQAPDGGLYALGWYSGPPASGGVERVSHSGVGAGVNAYQGLFPDGVGVAVLQTSAVPDAYVTAASLYDWSIGEPLAEPPAPPGPWTDVLVTLVAILVVGLAMRGVARSQRWAWRGRLRWRLARLAPLIGIIFLMMWIPSIGSRIVGRTATWVVLLSAAPVLVAAVWTVTAAVTVLVLVRLARLLGRDSRFAFTAKCLPREDSPTRSGRSGRS